MEMDGDAAGWQVRCGRGGTGDGGSMWRCGGGEGEAVATAWATEPRRRFRSMAAWVGVSMN